MRWCPVTLVLLAASGLAAAGQVTDEYVLRTYDVRDVLSVGTRLAPAPLGVFHEIDAATARGFRTNAGDDTPQPGTPSSAEPTRLSRAMEEELIRLVREALGRQAWRPAGGGALAIHNGRLCVWQRRQAHGRVEALLRRLRRRAATQVVVRVGLYVCSREAAKAIRERLKVSDLKPADPFLPDDAPPVKGALLPPDQVMRAVRLLNRTAGSRVIFSGTVPCLPMRQSAVEDVRQVVFVSRLSRSAGTDPAWQAEGGVASAGSVVGLSPVPSADSSRVQLGVHARLAHLTGIERGVAAPIDDRSAPERIGPLHRPVVRTTVLDMTLVVPSGQGVLVSGSPVTVNDEWGRTVSGQLLGVFWPTVAQADTKRQAAVDDLAALKAALEWPFGVTLSRTPLSEAIETLERTGVRIDLQVRPDGEAARALLARPVTLVRRETTLVEALGTLFGDRIERVELLPPKGIRLHVRAGDPATAGRDRPDAPVGTLTIRGVDGRTVTRLTVQRRDLTPAMRARIEEVFAETLKRQDADDPGR